MTSAIIQPVRLFSCNLCDRDILETAAKAVIENAGAAGPDGMTTRQLKENLAATLTSLQTELTERRYKPGAVKRVWIPKPDGKRRPLGIPNPTAQARRKEASSPPCWPTASPLVQDFAGDVLELDAGGGGDL